MSRRLYLDLDGVMADFDGSFPAVFGLDHRSLADDAMWLHINGHPSFFRDLPPMAGAVEFFRSIEHLDPIILTACPKSNYAHVAAQKVEWVRTHLSAHVTVLPVLGGSSKPLFMHAKGDILIDDFRRNTEAWAAAGGHAILHRGFDGTAAALAEAIGSYERQPAQPVEAVDVLRSALVHIAGRHSDKSVDGQIARAALAHARPTGEQARVATCERCGATSDKDAERRCIPDGDSCPGCEEPLNSAWQAGEVENDPYETGWADGYKQAVTDGMLIALAQPRPVGVPAAITNLNECRARGWEDGALAYRSGWNDCRRAALDEKPLGFAGCHELATSVGVKS